VNRVLPIALAIAACTSQRGQPSPRERVPVAAGSGPIASAPKRTADLLGAMARLVGLSANAPYLASWAQRIDAGQASIDGFIDELLTTDRFGSEIIPSLVFGTYVNVRNYYALPSGFILNHSPGPDGAYYLRAPCAPGDAVSVHPWWDLQSEVKVCPDSYRPDKWTISADEQRYQTKTVLTCGSQIGSPELETNSLCGCGPNLIRCMRDADQYEAFNRSLMDEVKHTTAYVVEHDLPMATLFTGNETFRDRDAELYYRREKIEALQMQDVSAELAGLDAWPQDGKWAPRAELSPGQHAGLLTAPQILHWNPDRRQRQRGYYEMMWCNLRNAFGATTEKVLELNSTGNNAFAHAGWQRMAHTPLCTTCHARLDYGFQFFMGYPDSRAGTYFMPALQNKGQGPLYGHDIDDLRGTAPLTPLGFAKLATAQPEFDECMTTHFATYVLGDQATSADVDAIAAAVKQTGTFKAPMKVALERYAARWRGEPHAPPAPPIPTVAAAGTAPPGEIAVSPPLRATLDRYCGDCHDSSQPPYSDSPDHDDVAFNFTGAALPRRLVVDMLDNVGFGTMPKKGPLDPPQREQVVHLLVDTLWHDDGTRAQALHYYLGRDRGLPAQQIDNAFYFIDTTARATSGVSWGALERALWSDQATITPGFVATTSLEALRACEQASKTQGTRLEDCLSWTTSLSVLSRDPP
jgi:hypothetical protein